MRPVRDSSHWRGWADGEDPGLAEVTSDRLARSPAVQNRWFPKIRSWIALGAPIELLSPLSVARVIAIASLLTWPVLGATDIAAWVVVVPLVLSDLVRVGSLASRRTLGRGATFATVALSLAQAAVVAATGAGPWLVTVVSWVLLHTAICAGLFASASGLVVALAGGVAVLGIAVRSDPWTDAAEVGPAVGLVAVALLSTAAVARSSRRSGKIDADTGVPNASGTADAIAAKDGPTIVATVLLRGVSEAAGALGHRVGTELVRRAVEDLGQVLPTGTTIGRGGADEVVVVVDLGGDDPDTAVEELIGRIDAAIGTGRYLVGRIEVALHAHVGHVVRRPAGSGEIEAVESLRRSTLAARTAAATGVPSAPWDGTTTALDVDDLQLLADLRTAPERGELSVVYQPQIRSADGEIAAAEALVRWTSPTHGVVPPGRFVPLAERTGLVDRLTTWVLDEVLDQQVRWTAEGMRLPVSVNVSPLSLRDVGFTDRVIDALERRSLDPELLSLEVTESAEFDIPAAVARLGPLRELGVRISIDDFGTGFTSLSVLPALPLDELKVDQQFVRNVLDSAANDSIVRSVCDLAHRLGIHVVAEGVASSELEDAMRRYGYDLLQGFHLARPMSADELATSVRAGRGHDTGRDATGGGDVVTIGRGADGTGGDDLSPGRLSA